MQSKLVKHQERMVGPKIYSESGETYLITATVRHDDRHGSGHNSFSVTGEIRRLDRARRWVEDSSGCIHDKVIEHFPEVAHLIKWHLSSTHGPLHYVANTVYLAGNCDHNGLKAGEVLRWKYAIRFGNSPITHPIGKRLRKFLEKGKFVFPTGIHFGGFEIIEVPHKRDPACFKPRYTFKGVGGEWHEAPFRTRGEAKEWYEAFRQCQVEFIKTPWQCSEGKDRQLDAARRSAVWPDASDKDLTAPGLKERLEARLPDLLNDFRTDVEKFGLEW